MNEDLFSSKIKTVLEKIGKAIEKGSCDDMRSYLADNQTATRNAIPYVRIDKINTNLSDIFSTDEGDVRLFKRNSWVGVLIVDRGSKCIFTYCTTQTLKRIPKNKSRKKPHYAQTLLNTLNREEVDPSQLTLEGFNLMSSLEPDFTPSEYEADFISIMEESLTKYKGYRYWVVTYETQGLTLRHLSAVLMDPNFNIVEERPLMQLLAPNFGDLTADLKTETKSENSVHSLVSIKPGLKGKMASEPEKQTEIFPKSTEESKEA